MKHCISIATCCLVSLLLITLESPLCGQQIAERNKGQETVGDRLFLWGHPAGVYNRSYTREFKPSKIEPVAAADYMGLRNMYFVRFGNDPALPFTNYYSPFKALDRVLWSLTGASGQTSQEERNAAFQLAAENKNVVGFIMDDFFHVAANAPPQNLLAAEGPIPASLTPGQLAEIHKQLRGGDRHLRLSVVVYTHQLSPRAWHHLQHVDEVTLWTWRPSDLDQLEENLSKLERIAPKMKIVLGCYMFDFNQNVALSVDRMRRQIELGHRWLKQGRIQGIIFLGSPICDLDLEAVEFTRNWIAQTRNQPL